MQLKKYLLFPKSCGKLAVVRLRKVSAFMTMANYFIRPNLRDSGGVFAPCTSAPDG